MTREEALQILDTIPTIGEQVDALELAIKALEQELRDCKTYIHSYKGKCAGTEECHECMWESKYEQEPCDDCISFPKGTLKKRGKGYVAYNYAWLKENWQTELKAIGIEPSIQPKPKTGHWIAQDIHNCHTDFRCSECGYIHSFMHLYGKPTADYTYCPKCGAKMLPTDSDKEWLPQYEGKWVTEKE